MIVINLKTYKEGTGQEAIDLARLAEQISEKIILVAQDIDIFRVSKATKLKIYAQHVDTEDYGAHTGKTLIGSVLSAGGEGSLLNHSENRIPFEQIKKTVEKAKELKFPLIVCVQDLEEAKKIAELNPDYIAYEPPELIGGDISVSTAKPEIIKDIVDAVKPIPVLVGAGVKNGFDVKKSLELGAKGVLVASGVVKAKDKKAAIKDLVR